MKKLITTATNFVLYSVPAMVLAQNTDPSSTGYGLNDTNFNVDMGQNTNLVDSVSQIINIILSVLGIIAVIIVLMGGFKWMTSQGNEEKVGEAKKLLSAGLIGLVIVLAAYAIARFVVTNLLSATGAGA